MGSVHVQHVSRLLLQIVSVLKSRHTVLSLREINSCLRICLHLLQEVFKTTLSLHSSSQPSSLASTPALSPFPTTPSLPSTPTPPLTSGVAPDPPTNYRSLGQLPPDLVLSHGDSILQTYDDYLAFFSEFVGNRVSWSDRGKERSEELQVSFSRVCSTLFLMVKLVLQSGIIAASTESHLGPTSTEAPPPAPVAPWLGSLMGACQDGSRPMLTLHALETLLMLMEMAANQPYQAANQGGGAPSLSLAVECRVITPRMVNTVVLTQQFVKVCAYNFDSC